MLINLRKTDNERFHRIGHVKRPFWKEVAGKINQRFRSNYSAQQCNQKFNDILKDYRVNILYYNCDCLLLSLKYQLNNFFIRRCIIIFTQYQVAKVAEMVWCTMKSLRQSSGGSQVNIIYHLLFIWILQSVILSFQIIFRNWIR